MNATTTTPTFACPLCDTFPFDSAADLGEHVATQHSTPAAPPVVERTLTASGRFETVDNGFGGTTTRPVQRRGDGPTEKQVGYALSLAQSRLAVDGQGRDDNGRSVFDVVAPALAQDDDSDTWLPALRSHYESMSRRDLSGVIEHLLTLPKLTQSTTQRDSAAAPSQTLTAGMYRVDEVIYKVQAARTTGNLYAKRLDGNSDDGFTFEYEQGAIRTVRDRGVRLTADEAQAFGRRTGTCCVCAAVLTNPESIALGIGPICGGRL